MLISSRPAKILWALLCIFITPTVTAQPPAPANAPAPTITDEQVTTAMEKAADFLLSQEKNDNWESPANPWPNPADTGAPTALILRALLDAGNNIQNDAEYHSKLFFRSATLAPAVVWLTQNAPPNDYVAALQAFTFRRFTSTVSNMRAPLDAIKSCRDACLAKLINARDPQGNLPPTTTAEITLAAANLAYRLETPDTYWQATEKFWRDAQLKDGSFPDAIPGIGFRRDIVGIEGLAALLAARSHNDTALHLTPTPDPAIDLALHYLDTHPNTAPSPRYLFALERIAQATGRKSFGNTPWFPTGAATLIHTQNPDGSWTGKLPPSIETAYALLFLANGRTPVLFNKLQYDGAEGRWNARPNDAAYFTHWLSIRLCDVPLQSQTVSLADPVDTWLDAPLLLITGSQDPHFTPQDLAKLRQFITAGGIIFSTADNASPAFTAAMKKYALEVTDHKFPVRQLLLPNHELYSENLDANLPNPPPLLGVSNGIRELWIHSPTDITADWQTRKYDNQRSFALGQSLHFYTTGMIQPRSNLAPLTVTPSPTPTIRTISLALIDYPGNAPFADCCTAWIKNLYPDQPLQPLPADHPLYTGTLPDGQKLDIEKDYGHGFFRTFGNLQLQRRVTTPNISALVVAGKTKIIFSPWGISSGLLGTNTWGILGYAPPAAQTLARNLLLYSQNPIAPQP